MTFYIGITDERWFDFLKNLPKEDVNFWRLGQFRNFRILPEGGLFLFKLHSPNDFIVGGGYYLSHQEMPLSLAWDSFGQYNGIKNIGELRDRINTYRKTNEADPVLGCTILGQAFFWPKDLWIPTNSSWWPTNIVSGKSFENTNEPGLSVWQQVQTRLQANDSPILSAVNELPGDRYGSSFLAKARLGQGGFRSMVTSAYQRRCAFTGERTLPVLQASHIQPYADDGPHAISNGILLRADLHQLFDRGYVTVTPDHDTYRIKVSPRIRKEFSNGREYYALDGQPLNVLPERLLRPAKEYVEFHNSKVFKD
jgi:putative restriction endonuclease